MAKAILNGKVIDTKNYDICAEAPTNDKSYRWMIPIFVFALILSFAHVVIEYYLGLAQLSDFYPVGVRITCDSSMWQEEGNELKKFLSENGGFDVDYVYNDMPTQDFFHASRATSAMYMREKLSSDTIYYSLYVDKDELLEIIEAYENGAYSEPSTKLPKGISAIKPYTDRELIEAVLVKSGDPARIVFIKQCLSYDIVQGMKFIYRWPAERHDIISSYYHEMIGEYGLSFAQAVYIAEGIILIIALLLASLLSVLGVSSIDSIDSSREQAAREELKKQNDFDYFGRADYRSPDDETKDEDAGKDEDDEDIFPDDYEDYPDRDPYSLIK